MKRRLALLAAFLLAPAPSLAQYGNDLMNMPPEVQAILQKRARGGRLTDEDRATLERWALARAMTGPAPPGPDPHASWTFCDDDGGTGGAPAPPNYRVVE